MTGEHLEITHGPASAVVNIVGAGLRAFEVGGVPYAETYADEPPMGAGSVLVPWPNRVAGATWSLGGETYTLEVTEPSRGHAIHGLVRHARWSVVSQQDGSVTLGVAVDSAPGWPFPFYTTISYALSDTGLTITHTVENRGDREMPHGVGTHPYPSPGKTDVDECALTLAAGTVLPVDPESLIPNGAPIDVTGTDYDFRPGRPVRDVELDTAFGGCEPGADGLVRNSLRSATGVGVEVWAEPVFKWVQVFTTPDFPGKTTRAVAIEPMTCPPDALNSGEDLLWLKPGESWAGRWGITPLGA
ncbi:aldose 1-epimerase family protein [Actinophytocola sp.]|uniref:aldose 1-epimerase family protein n=1 Tax=Actinophytocola sp. TaxID=1872138 RepID=UPI002ED516C6